MTPRPRTTVISVTYNSEAMIGAMLDSMPPKTPTVIVDNASADASAKIAQQHGASIINLEENLGFGPACNHGAAKAETEFLFFLNPDALLQPDCITELENAADRYAKASAFNPRISGRNGREYFKRRSVLLDAHEHMPRGWPAADREVSVLSGAALFCRRSCFEAVGGFDPAIFLYHEDDDLALRMRRHCGPLMFIREAAVVHQEGRSSPRSTETAAIKSYHMGRSRVYAMRKHGIAFPRARNLVSAVANFLNPALLASSRKRAQASAFLNGVLSSL